MNAYTGATTVDDGTLAVNGSIASSSLTTVNAGGKLGGTGTVGSASINGGTLAPGNSIGTLTVNGDLTFAPGSTYAVEFSSGSSDRTNVTGTATLDGAVDAAFVSGGAMQRSYTILSAAGGCALSLEKGPTTPSWLVLVSAIRSCHEWYLTNLSKDISCS